LALQAEKLAVKAEPYNQRSVSEYQWLLANYCHYVYTIYSGRLRDAG
jgi:hypothetical protein